MNMDQTVKADSGKPRLTLVPQQIIFDIAKVREYGVQKYGDEDNWKKVEKNRYKDAAFRHFMAYLSDPNGVDAESGLPHLAHLACNIAFLCEMDAATAIDPIRTYKEIKKGVYCVSDNEKAMEAAGEKCSTCIYRHKDNYCIINGMDVGYAVKADKKGVTCPLDDDLK